MRKVAFNRHLANVHWAWPYRCKGANNISIFSKAKCRTALSSTPHNSCYIAPFSYIRYDLKSWHHGLSKSSRNFETGLCSSSYEWLKGVRFAILLWQKGICYLHPYIFLRVLDFFIFLHFYVFFLLTRLALRYLLFSSFVHMFFIFSANLIKKDTILKLRGRAVLINSWKW